MNEEISKYYEQYSITASFVFLWKALAARTGVTRASWLNRQRDYLRLSAKPQRFRLHRELNECLEDAARGWDAHDYGEGYFYQSLDRIGISGLRDTRARAEAMGLNRLLAGKTVLEVGCNSGFLSLTISPVVARVVGFDVNPYLIRIARRTAEYLREKKAEFLVSSLEEFTTSESFDAVLSFANHSTYDGKMQQPVEEYVTRWHAMLKPGGLLLFESHAPDYEGDAIETVCSLIDRHFEVQERRVLHYGTRLDDKRTFVIAKRPEIVRSGSRRPDLRAEEIQEPMATAGR